MERLSPLSSSDFIRWLHVLRCRSFTQSITFDEHISEFTGGIMLAVIPSYFTLIYLWKMMGYRGGGGGGRRLICRRRDGDIAKCQVFSSEAAPETLLNADLFEVVADDLLTLNKNLQFKDLTTLTILKDFVISLFVPKETLGQVIHDLDFVKTYQRPIAFGVGSGANGCCSSLNGTYA
ncbi:hypothetical protein L1987_33193 [Smallanthus sonchifolius]|uniref:Uncharacterized protein n=1 Tax=Smallanthus sonchifolius TaxID=185202 RepID=A0ACB9HRJ1_9ASTR|nr:hypothetical protein L1987_33193 [Smallanthus sonchifolius]